MLAVLIVLVAKRGLIEYVVDSGVAHHWRALHSVSSHSGIIHFTKVKERVTVRLTGRFILN
jgi:uncharacterized membrane protein